MYALAIIGASAVLFAFSGVPPSAPDVLTHLFLLHGFFTQYVYSIDSPLWTMGIDAGFYLVLPIVALALRPFLQGKPRGMRVRAIVLALACLIVASVSYRFIQCSAHPEALYDYPAATVYVRNLFGMVTAFALGLFIALAGEAPIGPA